MWSGKLRRAGGQTGFRIQDSGFRGENEEHPLSADVEWESPQGRGGQTGFGIHDSGERMKSIRFPQMWSGKLRRAGGQTGFGIQDSGFRGGNEEHPLSADVEWEAPQGRGGQTGFGIQDSGEGTKSICFPPSADGLAMQDSGFRIQDQVRE